MHSHSLPCCIQSLIYKFLFYHIKHLLLLFYGRTYRIICWSVCSSIRKVALKNYHFPFTYYRPMKALLITDDPQEQVFLMFAMQSAGLQTKVETNINSALDTWTEKPAELIVVALNSTDPLDAVHELRRTVIVPIAVIVEQIPEKLHAELILSGADYVAVRPYSMRLLVAYLRGLVRRAGGLLRKSFPPLQHEEVHLNPSRRTVSVGQNSPQRLSQLEFRLLHSLMINRGNVLPTETIVELVWGYTGEGDRSLVRGLVNRLRVKIEPNPNTPQYIRTIPRVGYIFGSDST